MVNPSPPPIVALTGFMGAGKTSVGHALAALLGWTFFDLDHEIELHQKAPIRELFRRHGEPQFRHIETEALHRMPHQVSAPTVIAVGGGTFIQTAGCPVLAFFWLGRAVTLLNRSKEYSP